MAGGPAPVPVGIDAFLIAIASLAIILRLISRKLSHAGFWWDDWLAIIALPFSITISVSFLAAAYHGFGRHGGNPTFFLHVLYFDEIWYNTVIALTKLSVLCFYRRIFAVARPLRITIWIVGGIVLAWWIAFTLASILQCIPIEGYWNPKIKAHCEYKYGFFLGQAVPNIMLDFVLLFLPLQPLWKLHMKRPHKLALGAVFVLGYCNPVISIIRIVSFVQLGNKTGEDINYGFVAPALWSAAECALAIVSCSIPSMTHLFRRIIGINRLTSTKRSAEPSSDSNRSNRGRGIFLRKSVGTGDSGDFERLDESHIDNAGLVSSAARGDSEEGPRSYGLRQIEVKKNFDVTYAQNSKA